MAAGHHATVNYYVGHGVTGMPDLSTQPASARYDRGSHRQFAHRDKAGVLTVSGNAGRDVPPGTLNAILKAAGLREQTR